MLSGIDDEGGREIQATLLTCIGGTFHNMPVVTKFSRRSKAADSEQSQDSSMGPAQSTEEPSALLGSFKMSSSSRATPIPLAASEGTGSDVGAGRGLAGFSSFSQALQPGQGMSTTAECAPCLHASFCVHDQDRHRSKCCVQCS